MEQAHLAAGNGDYRARRITVLGFGWGREATMAGIRLIDDDSDTRGQLAEILREEGYLVATACNGLEGFEKLKTDCAPCVILLDLMMPVMDGLQFRCEAA